MTAPKTDMTIRELRPDDASAACLLVREVFDEYVAPLFKQEGIDEFHSYAEAGAMADRLANGGWGLAATAGGRVIGVVEVRDDTHLAFFFVDGAVQGQGVGKELIKHYLARCLEAAPALEEVRVNASPNAVETYQRLGYRALEPEQEVNGIRFTSMGLAIDDARRLGLAPAGLNKKYRAAQAQGRPARPIKS